MSAGSQPRPTDLARYFLDAMARQGIRIDRGQHRGWDALCKGLDALATRTLLETTRTFDAGFLDRATGDDLAAYCTSRSNGMVTRFPAVAARGRSREAAGGTGGIELDRATTDAGAGMILAGTEFRVPFSGSSFLYTVSEDTAIYDDSFHVSCPVVASTAGAASNVGLVTAGIAATGNGPTLFDATLLPTSIFASRGADEESDDELRERMRLYEQAKKGGVKAAVAFAAMMVNGVKHVVLAEFLDGHIGALGAIYVGDANWTATDDIGDDVATSLERWRAFGASFDFGFIQTQDVAVAGTITMARPLGNYRPSQLRAAAAAAALEYFNDRIDPYAYDLTMLSGRIARIHEEVSSVVLTSPSTSVVSPISPTSLAAAGKLPEHITRFRLQPSAIKLELVGLP